MYEGKTHTLFFRYAVPQMVGLLFNSIYTIVDGVFIGNRLGRDAMAAAAVSVPLIEILISLALAVASGAAVMIATRLGQGKIAAAQKIFNTAIWMIGSTGLLIALAGNVFLRPLAELLGATPDILNEAAIYLWYIVTFAPFQLFSFLLGSMVRNDGRPKLAMTAMILGAVSNIVLDYVFMYPLNMGIAGAALATALGPVFSHFMAVGAEKKNRDMRRFSTGIFLGAGIISYGLIVFFAGDFFSIFSPNDLELVAFAQSKSIAYFCGFFLAGYNILMISFWQSTASTNRALIISLSRSLLWPSILMITLPLIFGREAIWICQSSSEAITACIAIMVQLRSNRNKRS